MKDRQPTEPAGLGIALRRDQVYVLPKGPPMAQPATKKPAQGTKVKVTIKLDPTRWQSLRIQALREGRSASEIIDELIAPYLKRKKR